MLRPWSLEIQLDKKSNTALYLQIADAIINAIKSGKLSSGNALPGSRQLAVLLHVNRNTVIEALDILTAEGWLITMDRKGTFVADVLPESGLEKKQQQKANTTEEEIKPHLVFDDGLPDSRLAPMTDLARAYREIFNRKSRWQIMGYSNEFGNTEFRKAIAQMRNEYFTRSNLYYARQPNGNVFGSTFFILERRLCYDRKSGLSAGMESF